MSNLIVIAQEIRGDDLVSKAPNTIRLCGYYVMLKEFVT